ncbi:MAG: lysophospholipid acyltransferase family protein, partial [Prolixibacteraceae bacterium]
MAIIFLKQMARLPFGLLYIISDLLFILIYKIIGYRKKVVIQNLKNAFPEKSKKEIDAISRKFFKHLCDLTVETIKMSGMTEKDFRERMKFTNPELINNYFEQKKSVVVLTMHYNNWEWSSCIPLFLKPKILGVYKPLHNSRFNRHLNKSRSQMGSTMISSAQVLRTVIAADKIKEPFFLWLSADQT